MISCARITRPAEYWDGLTTKEQLFAAFKPMANDAKTGHLLSLPVAKCDADDLAKKGQELEELAEKMIPILREIYELVPHSPQRCEENNKMMIKKIFDYVNSVPEGMGLYTAFLLLALDGHYVELVKRGFNVPEIQAAQRAYKRYVDISTKLAAETARKKAEFEKTPEYRLQVIEMKTGIRDHIDYPK